ncbi:MAG TPA: hypothetical protein VMB03_08915 [Bryobacteraceae bacterium]|nr:hypothetical protein [Bryobacteraceae bacterium]
MIDESTLQQRIQKIGDLIGQLDSGERARSRELLASVMDLHGEALDRMLQRLREAGEAGNAVIAALAGDPVVASVLLLYGLHPLDFETRVHQAVERIRSSLRAYGVFAEVAGTAGGEVRIRLRGVDSSFTARTVRSALEEELYAAAPDAASVTLLGLEKFAPPDFVPLETIAAAGKT